MRSLKCDQMTKLFIKILLAINNINKIMFILLVSMEVHSYKKEL